jgi:hypothetical protein
VPLDVIHTPRARGKFFMRESEGPSSLPSRASSATARNGDTSYERQGLDWWPTTGTSKMRETELIPSSVLGCKRLRASSRRRMSTQLGQGLESFAENSKYSFGMSRTFAHSALKS